MKKLLFTALCGAPLWLFAQGFQVNLQGQKQIGMAGAGSALALDEASVFYNPGAVSMLDHNSISAGVNPLFFKSAFQQTGTGNTEYVRDQVVPPFAAYAVWGPKSNKWKLGIGVYTPFGGVVDWGEQWSGRYSLTSLNLKAIYFQPTLSIKLSDAVGLGAGFVYNHGEVDLQRNLPISSSLGEAHAQLKGTGSGYGWNAGIYVKTVSNISFALTYKSKVVTKLKDGDAIFTNIPASLQANFPQPNTFNSELPLPSTATFGVGVPLWGNTALAFDASWVNWSVYKELAFDYAQPVNGSKQSVSPRNYRDGGSVKLGLNSKVSESFTLRLGAGYAFTPVQNGYVTPEAPDADRYLLSAGLGYAPGKHVEINASFLFEDIKARTQKNLESGLDGTFKTYVYAPGISLTYKW